MRACVRACVCVCVCVCVKDASDELHDCIKRLKRYGNKSAGIDGILSRMVVKFCTAGCWSFSI